MHLRPAASSPGQVWLEPRLSRQGCSAEQPARSAKHPRDSALQPSTSPAEAVGEREHPISGLGGSGSKSADPGQRRPRAPIRRTVKKSPDRPTRVAGLCARDRASPPQPLQFDGVAPPDGAELEVLAERRPTAHRSRRQPWPKRVTAGSAHAALRQSCASAEVVNTGPG